MQSSAPAVMITPPDAHNNVERILLDNLCDDSAHTR